MRMVCATPTTISSGTLTKTLMRIKAAAGEQIKLHEVLVSFQGSDSTAVPIIVQIFRPTNDAGSGTSQPPTVMQKGVTHALQSEGLIDFSAEDTVGDILRTACIHPQAGTWHYVVADPDEFSTEDGGRLAVRIIAPGATVPVAVTMEFDE